MANPDSPPESQRFHFSPVDLAGGPRACGEQRYAKLEADARALGIEHGRHIDDSLPMIDQYELKDTRSYDSLCNIRQAR
ncbi:MAG: hypothetical protein ACI8QZ_002991 [Chlamydiales bacterium]|jgi:hypothetical protein